MDQIIRTLQENNIEILDGPNEIPGSERWIYFMDPDLNVLEYIVWLNREKSAETFEVTQAVSHISLENPSKTV